MKELSNNLSPEDKLLVETYMRGLMDKGNSQLTAQEIIDTCDD